MEEKITAARDYVAKHGNTDEARNDAANIYTEEHTMIEYIVTYNNYFGFCVVATDWEHSRIVFTGSIEDCNKKCIALNSSR